MGALYVDHRGLGNAFSQEDQTFLQVICKSGGGCTGQCEDVRTIGRESTIFAARGRKTVPAWRSVWAK